VIGHYNVSPIADGKVDIRYPRFIQPKDLISKDIEVQNGSVPDDETLSRSENARWNEVELVYLPVDINGMTGIVASLEPGNDIIIRRKTIDDLALSLVAPLGANDNCNTQLYPSE